MPFQDHLKEISRLQRRKKLFHYCCAFLEFRFAADTTGMTLNVTLSLIFSSRLLRDSIFYFIIIRRECCFSNVMNIFGIRRRHAYTNR
jgi:hypothetical protein